MFMDFPLCEEVEVEWDGDAFKRMKNLKTLIIRNGLFSEGPKHLPNTLEYWNGGDILHRFCQTIFIQRNLLFASYPTIALHHSSWPPYY